MWIANRLKAENGEATANKYVIHCMSVTVLITIGIWLLNVLDIFLVDKDVMAVSVFLSIAVYLAGMSCWIVIGVNNKCVKYLMILWTSIITTVMGTGLTYHAIIASVLPILFCSLYSSKKMMIYTFVLTIMSTVIIVFVGYHVGICDANMTLLTGKPLSDYIDTNGNFTRIDINDRLVWSLSLFFVLPRCLIYTMCMLVCYNIGKIISKNVEHAKRMEVIAEIDGMTGLYNCSKYLSMFSNIYEDDEKVAVIYWDINNLKTINDTQGHENGDLLIRAVAKSIHDLVRNNDMAFRIGGDEFVMILKNSGEEDVKNIAHSWKESLDLMKSQYPFEISASIGYAYGQGKDLQELINVADTMMYEDKKKFHNQQKNSR